MSYRKRALSLLILSLVLLVSFTWIPVVFAEENNTIEESAKNGGGGYAASGQLEGFGYTAKIFDNSNGLPTSDANYILCADEGYIWLGGYSGILLYDGSVFERLDASNGLTSGRCLYQDSKSRIWVGTNDNGLVMFDKQRNRKQFTDKDGLPARCVRSIIEDKNGNIIVGTTAGVAYIDKNFNISHISDRRIDAGRTMRLTADKSGKIYGYCDNGYIFTMVNSKFIDIFNSADIGVERITSLLADPNENGKVYIGTNSGNIYYGTFGDLGSKLFMIKASPLQGVYWLSYECDRVWALSHDAVGYIDLSNNFNVVKDLPMDSDIEMLTSDYQGNIWVSSTSQGVMKIVSCNFYNITRETEVNDLMVYANYIYDNHLYIGTEEGLYIIDRDGNPTTNELTDFIGKSKIRHITSDYNGNLWICVYSNGIGLVCLNNNGEIINFTKDDGLPTNQVRCALGLADGSIVVGTNKGISFINNNFKVVKRYGNQGSTIDSSILSLCEKDGDIYIGTDGDGIYILTGKGLRHLNLDYGLTSDIVMRIKWDERRGVFWLITSNSIQYIKNDIIVNVTTFPYNNCYDVYFEKDNNNLWILASNGIYCVDAETLVNDNVVNYKHYTNLNGLPSIPTANSYSTVDDNGDMFVACRRGVCKFNIDKFVEEYVDIKFDIKSIICDGTVIVPDVDGVYTIPEGAKRVAITPAILDYSEINPKIHMGINGIDDEGITAERSDIRPLEYTGLKYGTYYLHIQILDENRDAVLQEKNFVIKKNPRFFEMTLVQVFIVFIFICVGGILVWRILLKTTISKQYMKLQEANDELERANGIKTRFLANISDFLRTPLITIMGADEMILRRDPSISSNEYFFSVVNDALDIKKASETLLELIDSLINISKIETGKMILEEKEYNSVDAMRSAVSVTRHLCDDKGLSFEVEVDERMPLRLYGDIDKISHIIWTLLNNAVKYTTIGGITVRATVDSIEGDFCYISISVMDTGIGVSEEYKDLVFDSFDSLGTMSDGVPYEFGLGLCLSNKYAKLMNGSIDCTGEYGKGAEFTFRFRQHIVDATAVGTIKEHSSRMLHGLYIPSFIAPEAEVLIVDNNSTSLNIIKSFLKDTKMFVGEASTGEECIEKIKFGNYNIVLMDYHLPDISVEDLILRIHEVDPNLAIYALTSLSTEGEEFYLEKGFNGVLLKPVDSDVLEKTILKHIPSNIFMKLSDTEGDSEDIELPADKEWLFDVKELNVADGILKSGGAGKYLQSLHVFMGALDSYVNGIEDAYKNLDIKLYTIKMHSLKTSFVIVGANELVGLAEALEAAGNRNDVEFLADNTEKFLSECRSLYTKLTKLHSL
ncbi:MAG: response regulator [Pseudobutyrivibrio sp.]|nr:response regulator [Pseudobutyrivibrio sp.]